MHPLSDVVGKSIISAETGDKLGSVSDALLDPALVRIVGLVVGGGLLGQDRVLPYGNVQTLGGDTVVVRSPELIPAKEWRAAGTNAVRSSTVTGKSVVTASGRRIGAVSDLFIEQASGTLAALDVQFSDLGGLRKRRSRIPITPDVRIGPDAVVVPESAAEEPRASEREEEAHEPADPDAQVEPAPDAELNRPGTDPVNS